MVQIPLSCNGRCSTQLHPRNSQGNCYFACETLGISLPVQTASISGRPQKETLFLSGATVIGVSWHQTCWCLTRGHFLIFPPCEAPQYQGWRWTSASVVLLLAPKWGQAPGRRPKLLLFPPMLPSLPAHSCFITPLSLSLFLSPSASPTPGPTVIGIPSGSWDPYKHSRHRERGSERGMAAERKRKPASQYAGSLEHWVTVAAASFVCVCPILCLKQSPPPLSAHTGKPDSNTPQAACLPVIRPVLHLRVLMK